MSYKSRKASDLTSQERTMVKRIIHASLLEQERGEYQYSSHDAVNRAAFYTGLTPQVLVKIRADMHVYRYKTKNNDKKDGNNAGYGLKLSHHIFLMDVIDNIFTDELLTRNPTCGELFRAVENDLPGEKYNTMYVQVARLIKKRYESKDDRKSSRFRKELFEIEEVGLKRYTYLKEIREYRQQNRNIIYLDETWIDERLNCTKIWENLYDIKKIEDLITEVILITLSAASKDGFIPEALKMTTAMNTETDTIHLKHFKSWLSQDLLRTLPKSSIIVVDNELYHECSMWKRPCRTTINKEALCNWLTKNDSGFNFTLDTSVDELYRLVQKQAQINTVKGIKDVLERENHKLLKLPAFMSKLNPFVLMWNKLKTDLGSSETESMKISDVRGLIADKISKITPEDWKAFDEEVCKQEEYLWTKDKRLLDNKEKLERLYMEQKKKEIINK